MSPRGIDRFSKAKPRKTVAFPSPIRRRLPWNRSALSRAAGADSPGKGKGYAGFAGGTPGLWRLQAEERRATDRLCGASLSARSI